MTAVSRPFCHTCGTDAGVRDGSQLTAPEAVGLWCRYLGGPIRGVLLGPRLVHAEDARPLPSLQLEAGVALPEKKEMGHCVARCPG